MIVSGNSRVVIQGIYSITNIKDGKKYIGSSLRLNKRLNEHKNDLKSNRHTNTYLQRAFNKHGEQVFNSHIEELTSNLTDAELRIKEAEYCELYNTYNREFGYNNIVEKGQSRMHSDETKAKMKKTHEKYKKSLVVLDVVSLEIIERYSCIEEACSHYKYDVGRRFEDSIVVGQKLYTKEAKISSKASLKTFVQERQIASEHKGRRILVVDLETGIQYSSTAEAKKAVPSFTYKTFRKLKRFSLTPTKQ